eukprot:scaffold77443_cov18-Tisochrysis_lutea.AAC.3
MSSNLHKGETDWSKGQHFSRGGGWLCYIPPAFVALIVQKPTGWMESMELDRCCNMPSHPLCKPSFSPAGLDFRSPTAPTWVIIGGPVSVQYKVALPKK